MSEYRVVPPAAPLRPFVESLWVHLMTGADPAEDRRILPDGRIDLVWIRGSGVLVAGPQTRYTSRPVRAPFLAFGARFHPGAAASVLRLPASELLDDYVALDAVAPRLATRLDHRLQSVRDRRQAFGALNEELARHIDRLGPPDPVVRAVVDLLGDRSTTVADAAARTYVSERQLQRRFAEHVGYGPKTLQRILRLQRAVAQLGSRDGAPELAATAALAGYADQSHLTRESRRLTGLTPAELARWIG